MHLVWDYGAGGGIPPFLIKSLHLCKLSLNSEISVNQLFSPQKGRFRLFDMNFREISDYLKICPSLIVPIGVMEPIGSMAPIGIQSRCSVSLAESLSSRLKVLTAPVLNYSCSSAFKSFEGCAGIRGRTFSNIILELCKDWIFQGFKRILLINVSSENDEAVNLAMKRINYKSECVKHFSLQSDPRIINYVKKINPGEEYGRSELLILSIAEYLFADLISEKDGLVNDLPDIKQYQIWKKRGKDPQKFRKLFPQGSTSAVAAERSADFGRDLFSHIISILEEDYSPFLKIEQNAFK